MHHLRHRGQGPVQGPRRHGQEGGFNYADIEPHYGRAGDRLFRLLVQDRLRRGGGNERAALQKYENEGYKGGIVYTCGATIKDDNLILYYGGADTVVCVATCNLKKFVQQIKDNNGKI